MLLGVPVIVTNYSGSTDYATPECALVVDYKLVSVLANEYPGVTGQRWAEANIETAAHHMQWVHEHPDEARELGMRGRRQIERLYNTRTVGEGMRRALDLPEQFGLVVEKTT
jgi:glycosyltransferase involved in cell wall biosynthesis